MSIVKVHASRDYDIVIESDCLSTTGTKLRCLGEPCKVALITDDNVYKLYAGTVQKSLEQAGYHVSTYIFAHGEQSKNLDTYGQMLLFLGQNGFNRNDLIVALGGGVTGDMAGFAAATYMRGIRYVQIPTSLLACIDSSVGGKTGVDLPMGKNLAGAFHQPSLVLIDAHVLQTLPDEFYKDGLGEGMKYALLCGGEIYDILLTGLGQDNMERFIELCVSYKRDIVEADEKESGQRRLLNLGHSIGHCIEKLSDYKLSHGLCVARGIFLMADYCRSKSWLSSDAYHDICALLAQYDMPTDCPFTKEEIRQTMLLDKKVQQGVLWAVTIHGFGDCRVTPLKIN